MAGFIYIMTNPSFDYVKIGYADNVEERLKVLNSSECTPFAFRVYATYAVGERLVDHCLHDLIDNLNPDLRTIDDVDGKIRKREFYAMSAEEAFNMLMSIAKISGTTEKLKMYKKTATEKAEENDDKNTAERIKRIRRPNYDFVAMGIPVGTMIEYVNNPEIKAKVAGSRKVEYKGKEYSLTKLTRTLNGLTYDVPPCFYWKYNGKTLNEYYEETFEIEDNETL